MRERIRPGSPITGVTKFGLLLLRGRVVIVVVEKRIVKVLFAVFHAQFFT